MSFKDKVRNLGGINQPEEEGKLYSPIRHKPLQSNVRWRHGQQGNNQYPAKILRIRSKVVLWIVSSSDDEK